MAAREVGVRADRSIPHASQSSHSSSHVSSNAYHTTHPDLILLAVTSQMRAAPVVGEAAIMKWEEAGLLELSTLEPPLATTEKDVVLREPGRLEEVDHRVLHKVLDEIFKR